MIKAGVCVHFTGVQNDICKAAITYESVRKEGPLPCITLNGKRRDCCTKYQEPTSEQIAQDEAETEALLANMRLVMAAVKPWRTWKRNNRVAKNGVIECPVCKGRLHLNQAAYNGHVWGKCETEECVQWME